MRLVLECLGFVVCVCAYVCLKVCLNESIGGVGKGVVEWNGESVPVIHMKSWHVIAAKSVEVSVTVTRPAALTEIFAIRQRLYCFISPETLLNLKNIPKAFFICNFCVNYLFLCSKWRGCISDRNPRADFGTLSSNVIDVLTYQKWARVVLAHV